MITFLETHRAFIIYESIIKICTVYELKFCEASILYFFLQQLGEKLRKTFFKTFCFIFVCLVKKRSIEAKTKN